MLFHLALLLVPLCATAADGQLHLLHRVYGPGVPEQSFSLRATLDISTYQLTPAPQSQETVAQFYNDVKGNKAALYQLALQTADFDPSGDRLGISAVKACHIPTASADHLILHFDLDGALFHADYYLGDIPPSGACPSSKQLRALNLDQATLLHPSNTSVSIRHATYPPLPELRVSPPLSPKGQPIPPEPEKTFVQKYWLYIVAALGILLLTGGPPPEEGGRPASGR